ncbi:MAG: hypothetical protein MUO27_05350 [Sedimentisphaerales bacterium]|nr:hypothetical protein [Sedimentisphaerales bacterium]
MVRQEKPLQESGEIAIMLLAEDTKSFVEDIFSSYETRMRSVESLFETTNQILQGFQDSVLDTRQEREKISGQLKENLARNGSLRRKDFDNMMSVVSSYQDRQGQEVRNLSRNYLREQADLVQELRENLRNFTDALAEGEAQRVKEFHSLITGIFARQEQRKNEVVSKLKEYQKDQQDTARMLNELLAKGRELRTRDLKSMLSEFQRGRNERIAHQEERRGQVKGMLGEFKAKRVAAEQNRLSRCQVE